MEKTWQELKEIYQKQNCTNELLAMLVKVVDAEMLVKIVDWKKIDKLLK